MLLIANDVKLICKRFLSQVVVFFLVNLLKRLQTVFVFYDEVGEGQSELICSIVRISANAKTAEEAKRSSRIAGYAHYPRQERTCYQTYNTLAKSIPILFQWADICWL